LPASGRAAQGSQRRTEVRIVQQCLARRATPPFLTLAGTLPATDLSLKDHQSLRCQETLDQLLQDLRSGETTPQLCSTGTSGRTPRPIGVVASCVAVGVRLMTTGATLEGIPVAIFLVNVATTVARLTGVSRVHIGHGEPILFR